MANKSQPFHEVIFDICAKQVIPVDMKDDKDIDLIKMLCTSSLDALHNIQEKPIMAKRPNEVGNKIEPYIQNAINSDDKYRASKLTCPLITGPRSIRQSCLIIKL